MNILVVDNNKDIRLALNDALESEGYNIFIAKNGVEAVACVGQYVEQINLVMMDINMPEMNGLDAGIKIRELNSKLPIVFISGGSAIDVNMLGNALAYKCIFMHKPYAMKTLFNSIESLLCSENSL